MPDLPTARPATQQLAIRRAHMGLIFTAVGLLWIAVSAAYTGRLTPASLTAAGMAAASALIAYLVLLRRAARLPVETTTHSEVSRLRRILVAINILEWVAVATACAVLALVHLPEYIPTASGIIVGLYLFPIAGALRAPLHTVTAALLVGWNAAALAFFSRWRQSSTGAAGTGTILLASAAITMAWALWRTRSVPHATVPVAADLLTP